MKKVDNVKWKSPAGGADVRSNLPFHSDTLSVYNLITHRHFAVDLSILYFHFHFGRYAAHCYVKEIMYTLHFDFTFDTCSAFHEEKPKPI